MKKLLQLAVTALLALCTSQANASISIQTNVASIWHPDVIDEPVEEIRGEKDQPIRDVDVAAETSMKADEASYYLLLDMGFTEDEAMMILLLDSVLDAKPRVGVYIEREFE